MPRPRPIKRRISGNNSIYKYALVKRRDEEKLCVSRRKVDLEYPKQSKGVSLHIRSDVNGKILV